MKLAQQQFAQPLRIHIIGRRNQRALDPAAPARRRQNPPADANSLDAPRRLPTAESPTQPGSALLHPEPAPGSRELPIPPLSAPLREPPPSPPAPRCRNRKFPAVRRGSRAIDAGAGLRRSEPCHHIQRHSNIIHRPRHRPHVIQAQSQWLHAAPIDQAHTLASAPPLRKTTPARESIRRCRCPSRGTPSRWQPRRPTRRSIRPATCSGFRGIANGPEMRIVGRDPVRQLVQSGFPHHHRARRVELLHHRRIAIGHKIGEDLRARRGANAFGPHQVFVRDRNAMQRPAIDALRELPIQLLSARRAPTPRSQ